MTERLRIGLLTPSFAGVTGLDSGIGVHFRHLADALTAVDAEVQVLVVSGSPATAAPSLPYSVQLALAPVTPAMRLVGRASWQLHQWLHLRSQHKVAALRASAISVHLWETTSTGALALRLLGQPERPPVTVRVSTTAAQLRTTNRGRQHWIQRRIESWESAVIFRGDRVFTHSASHRTSIANAFNLAATAIPIIPHGIPLPPPAMRPATTPGCHLLFVGRLEHRKGIDLLLAALPAFLQAIPHARVTLAGRDPEGYWQRHWLSRATADEARNVTFAGVVEDATLTRFYRQADLFVAPSRYESFGLIFVEAMAHSLPVIALRAPGAADLIESGVTGELVAPEDPSALSAALIALGQQPGERDRLGTAARRAVEQRYSLSALSTASLAFYRETLSLVHRTRHPR